MKELTSEWVAKAENDYATADLALHAGKFSIPNTACFHCQQCAEKYLKAYLQEYDLQFLPRHNLMPLLDLCISLDKEYENLRGSLHQLESFSVAVRYPGMTISTQMAEQALVLATQARKFIRKNCLWIKLPTNEGTL